MPRTSPAVKAGDGRSRLGLKEKALLARANCSEAEVEGQNE